MLEQLDTQIFLFINKTCNTYILNRVMLFMTRLGGGEFLFVLAVLLLMFKDKRLRSSGLLLLSGLTVSYYVISLLKELIQRPRPFLVLQGINAFYTADGYSFPSGHSAMAFLAATIFALTFGRKLLFYFLAFLVAVSRVYLGVHFPYDVFVGACIGTFIGYFITRIYNQTVSR